MVNPQETWVFLPKDPKKGKLINKNITESPPLGKLVNKTHI